MGAGSFIKNFCSNYENGLLVEKNKSIYEFIGSSNQDELEKNKEITSFSSTVDKIAKKLAENLNKVNKEVTCFNHKSTFYYGIKEALEACPSSYQQNKTTKIFLASHKAGQGIIYDQAFSEMEKLNIPPETCAIVKLNAIGENNTKHYYVIIQTPEVDLNL